MFIYGVFRTYNHPQNLILFRTFSIILIFYVREIYFKIMSVLNLCGERMFWQFFPWTIQIDIQINVFIYFLCDDMFVYDTEDYNMCVYMFFFPFFFVQIKRVWPFTGIILTPGDKSLNHIPFHILSTVVN